MSQSRSSSLKGALTCNLLMRNLAFGATAQVAARLEAAVAKAWYLSSSLSLAAALRPPRRLVLLGLRFGRGSTLAVSPSASRCGCCCFCRFAFVLLSLPFPCCLALLLFLPLCLPLPVCSLFSWYHHGLCFFVVVVFRVPDWATSEPGCPEGYLRAGIPGAGQCSRGIRSGGVEVW